MATENFDRNLGFLVHDVSRLMRVAFDQRVKEIGLTRQQWRVLAHVLRHDGTTQSALADELEVGKASLGPMLARLAEKGWVERRDDPADRRVKRLYCTEKVKPIIAYMWETGRQLHGQALAGLDRDEQRRLVEALIHVKTNLVVLAPASAGFDLLAELGEPPGGEVAKPDDGP